MKNSAATARMLGLNARSTRLVAVLVAAAGGVMTTGCAGGNAGGVPKDAKLVGAEAFRGTVTPPAAPVEASKANTTAASAASGEAATSTQPAKAAAGGTAVKPATNASQPTNGRAGGGVVVSNEPGRRVVAVVDSPPKVEQGAPVMGRDVLADCMVGQINGRPVFASEILTPLDGKFRTDAKGVTMGPTARKWVQDAAKAIRGAVELRVRDELLLGEARARLTPEARQGLLYFLQRIDQWASGQQGGSRVEAEEAIRARTGEEYEKFLQDQRDQALIKELIKDNVTPAVRVPWRKVERWFAENQDMYNPPPRAAVRFVQIDASNAAGLARVEKAVGNEAAFKEVAESEINLFERASGGEMINDLDKQSYDKIEWVGNRSWNEMAAKLAPGEWGGPIESGRAKVWAYREKDIIAPPQTLEDAQLKIVTGLLAIKENQEQNEFFGQLLGKGSFTPISKMTMELLVLAAQRHLPPDVAALVRDANQPTESDTPTLERSPVIPAFDESAKPAKPGESAKPADGAKPVEPAKPVDAPKPAEGAGGGGTPR